MELIVVISIFGIMATVALFNFSDFSTNASLNNLAQDIALTIKQAQSASIAGKAVKNQNSPTFVPSYGVYFSVDNPNSFIYFFNVTDGPSQGYDGLASGEKLREISITTGDQISDLCVTDSASGIKNCGFSKLSVAFSRPFPDALITTNSGISSVDNAYIELVSAKGRHIQIRVTSLGSISVIE